MKHSSVLIGAILALAAASVAAQADVQGNASTQSQSSVAVKRDGASASNSSSGTTRAEAGEASANLSEGTQINATLTRPVDSSKNKPGDEVTATAAEDIKSNGQVVIPKGSKLLGHVTSARPRGSKSSGEGASNGGNDTASAAGSATGQAASQLGIVFDKAVLKDGREIPLSAGVQALAAGEGAAQGGMHESNGALSGAGSLAGSGRASGGGLLGGATGAVGGVAGGAASAAGGVGSTVSGTGGVLNRSVGAVGGLNAAGRLASDSRGVFGMKGLELTSVNSGGAKGSLITSTTRNVRLDRGTRMLLVTGGDASSGVNAAAGKTRGPAGSAEAAGNLGSTASAAGNAGKGAADANAASSASGGVNAASNPR
jgi:hypothetical protein